jgi:hypothetical protein
LLRKEVGFDGYIKSSASRSILHSYKIVDLLLFDGASNVQKAAQLVSVAYPRITVIHGAEHVVSLFFKDVFTNKPIGPAALWHMDRQTVITASLIL